MKHLFLVVALVLMACNVLCSLEQDDFSESFKLPNLHVLHLGNSELALQRVDPGRFMMGSDEGDQDEKPIHRVTFTTGFWMGVTEVTQLQWQAIMENNPSHFKGNDLPVEKVRRRDVFEFCRRVTEIERKAGRLPDNYQYTLPTEAQWEYVCRAGTITTYASLNSSDGLDQLAWYNRNSDAQTHPVGQKQPNDWGFYDMHGNVWEYCLDHCDYISNIKTDTYENDIIDPLNVDGELGVIRGGSWRSPARYCRSSNRHSKPMRFLEAGLGFRLVCSKK